MLTKQSLRELSPDEQVRMAVEEAGRLYEGNFIFFTNSEEIRDIGIFEHYAVPRVIALNKKIFFESGLMEKYQNRVLYGIFYTCTAYMAEDQSPPTLSF